MPSLTSLVGLATAAASAALVAAPQTATLAGRGTGGRVSGFAAAWGALSLGALVLDERAGR